MTWVEPNPSRDQVTEWQYFNGAAFVPVAKWPHPNTPRINPRYRHIDTQPELIPLASRYGFYYWVSHLNYDENPQEDFGFWHGDLLVKGDNHIGVTTEENKDGYTIDIDVKHYDSLPTKAVPGHEMKATWHKVGLNSRTYREEFPRDFLNNRWRYNMNTKFTAQESDTHWEFPPAPTIPQFTSALFAVTECFLFPEIPNHFADFNGIDSYIALDHDITGLNQDFVIDVDVRLHDSSNWWPVFGRAGLGGFIGMEGADLIFGSLRETTTWTPVDNVWFNWRLEFEQPDQLKVKLFIDDVEVATSIVNRFNTPINRIGVYKQGASGSLWAHADYKNLKVLLGDFPSTDVELDMPLFDNALDNGPESNNGTTFNMELPSV